jgi:hypothetical protein
MQQLNVAPRSCAEVSCTMPLLHPALGLDNELLPLRVRTSSSQYACTRGAAPSRSRVARLCLG